MKKMYSVIFLLTIMLFQTIAAQLIEFLLWYRKITTIIILPITSMVQANSKPI